MTAPRPLGPIPARTERPSEAALRVLRAVAGHPGAMTSAQCTAELGGHPNTVRPHLEHLVDSGLLERVGMPALGRGRPASGYRASIEGVQVAEQNAAASTTTALLEAVADQLAQTGDAPASARRLGRAWGERLTHHDGSTDLMDALAAQGFAPQRRADGIALRTCPMLQQARAQPDVVCNLHQGVIDVLSSEPLRLLPFAEPGCCLISRR